MKPAPFDYHAPETIEEALSLLAEHGDEGKLIAGGQTLGPMLNMRIVTPSVLIDLNRVRELDYLLFRDGALSIGALTRQATLEEDRRVRSSQPLAAAAIPWIAHRPIRNRGTVGGSLAHADPAAEWGGLACALDAELRIRGPGGASRCVPATEFFDGILETVLEPDELLVEIQLPAWPAAAGSSFREFARRRGDFALAGVACRVGLDRKGRCRGVRLGLIGVGDTALRARTAEALLEGEAPGRASFAAAAQAAAGDADPMSDLHGSADYRRHLVTVLAEDALNEAYGRARREDSDGAG